MTQKSGVLIYFAAEAWKIMRIFKTQLRGPVKIMVPVD